MNKTNLLVSFSGGKTSAYMAIKLKENYSDRFNLYFVFANTGAEHPKTFEFIQKVDEGWDLGVIWVEASVNPESGKGTEYLIVDSDTCSKKCEPFEEVIKKYGIPNKAYPHCTRELKQRPIHKWAKDHISGKYETALGIRTDEPKRHPKPGANNPFNLTYPLLSLFPTDKIDINDFWEEQDFNLEIEPLYGNCIFCWKKSNRKLISLIYDDPSVFDFTREMEAKYSLNGAGDGARAFFREKRNTDDLFKLSEDLGKPNLLYNIDENDGCSESCEPFQT